MGTRKGRERQQPFWMATNEIVQSPGNAFYDRLNQILDKRRFDIHVERLCRRCYNGPFGRPSLAPGVYFRMLLIGYFEGRWTQNEALRGGLPTRFRYASFWATHWMSRRRITRRYRERGDYSGWKHTKRYSTGYSRF